MGAERGLRRAAATRRALNVGSFHNPAERVLSTQVARKFVELFFGRMDARTASYEATGELLSRYFPASYRLLRPGITAEERVQTDGPVKIVFSDREERGALRLFLRALRRLPEELPWEAVIYSRTGALPTLRSSLRNRVSVVDDEEVAFHGADVVVAASVGQVTAPGVLVKALGVGAVPLAARVPVYEEVLRDGDLGFLFQLGDVDVLDRAARARGARRRVARPAGQGGCAGARGAQLVARRRPGRGDLRRARRAAPRPGPEAGGAGAGGQEQADRSRSAHAHRPLQRLRDTGRRAARDRPRRRASARSP